MQLKITNNGKQNYSKICLEKSVHYTKNKINQSDCDSFLFKATKSWWLAKSKIWTISATKGFLENI